MQPIGSGKRSAIDIGLAFAVVVCTVLLLHWRSTQLAVDGSTSQVASRANSRLAVAEHYRPVSIVVEGLLPGESVGDSPRFVNIGETPVRIYRGGDGGYHIVGKVRVMYRTRDGKWQIVKSVQDAKYLPQSEGLR